MIFSLSLAPSVVEYEIRPGKQMAHPSTPATEQLVRLFGVLSPPCVSKTSFGVQCALIVEVVARFTERFSLVMVE